jgi:hypothetical protein
MRTRFLPGAVVVFFFAFSLFGSDLPSIDEFATGRLHSDAGAAVAARAKGLAKAGAAIPVEARLRVPTFVWAPLNAAPPLDIPSGSPNPQRNRPEEAARAHMRRFASLYNIDRGDIDNASARVIHNTGRGAVIVKLRQSVGGIEIFREELNVLMDRNHQLVGVGGYISSSLTPGARGKLSFDLQDRAGIVAAIKDLTGVTIQSSDIVSGTSRGGYGVFTLPASSGVDLQVPIRIKKVYFHVQAGLEPGYYMEVVTRDAASHGIDAYAYVISASDGHILLRANLTQEANSSDRTPVSQSGTPYTYRIWADPTGRPDDSPTGTSAHPKVNPVPDGYQAPLVAQTDVTLPNYPFSMNDPWLPPGALETVGNNVDAYSDIFYPDGLNPVATPATPATGDFRAQTTGTNAFQHPYDPLLPRQHVSRQAATTQLFVDVNFLHDWFYDAGFDEVSGNAQEDNYGRGGVDGDRLLAEAQDSSGSNNANMYTPADGGNPRMQMYLFTGWGSAPFFTVLSPAAAAGKRTVGTASLFGAQTFDLTAEVVQAVPLSACTALTNGGTVAGKIVLVDREPTSGADSCAISTKITNIMNAGAAGVVLVNLSSWPDTIVDLYESFPAITIPVLTITYNSAISIKTELAASTTVTGRMVRDALFTKDGTLDNQIVAHEWGHYLSNRLIGNAVGLTANQARGMGEGWSDFLSLLLTIRAEDVAVPSNATWNGIYPTGTFAFSAGADGGTNQGYYFGVRRYPYSTDFTKMPLTFKHIQHGQSLPAGVPIDPNGLSNAQYHNTGEIWAQMLWECYAALLRDTQGGTPRLTFQEAQDRMKEYLVAALKLTPVNPTFLEARDAVLAAAAANDMQDFVRFSQAFAIRGAGAGAVAADRYSTLNAPVVESFFSEGHATVTGATLNDAGGSCDGDGVLDRGESGQLTITIKNTGTTLLDGMTGTVSLLTPGVTLPTGGAVVFPDVAPFATTSVSLPVAMDSGVSGIQSFAFSLSYTHPSLDIDPMTATFTLRGNTDLITAATATDTVESPSTPWTSTSGVPPGVVAPWYRKASGLQTLWHVDDAPVKSDERLESPPMTISPTGSLRVEFDHLFAFDYYYDGGMVEMSRNGGPWVDIGGGSYNGYIYVFDPPAYRPAFTYSINSPAHVTMTPTVAAGDIVRVRFRITTDSIVGARGWDIDTITFTGILETPFAEIVADTGCTKASSTRLTSSANPLKLGSNVTLTATVLAPGTPTGTVTFFDGVLNLGTMPAVNRVATLTTSSFSAGSHLLTAHYDGAAGFTQSTSSTLVQVVHECTSPPVITSFNTAQTIPAGSPASLSVTASGPEGMIYNWYQGIAPDTTTPVGTGATINVSPATTTKYWVRIINGCGTVDSANMTVTVVPGAKFYLVTPCRIYDSRNSWNSALAGNGTRALYLAWQCGIYTYAKAMVLNVTVVAPTESGFMTLYPAETVFPGTSTMNFRAGRTRANNAIVPLSPGGYMNVYNGASSPVHFIIDVTGFFQ